MSFLPKVRRLLRIRERSPRDQAARDVEAEIAFHLEERTDDLVREGLPREEAAARARAEFGDLEAARRSLPGRAEVTERRRRLGEWWDGVRWDFRHALRRLRKSRAMTVTAVLSLGLAIGAAAAIFGVAEPVLVRPLPYDRPGELYTVWNTYPGWRGHEVLGSQWAHIPLSYPEYRELRARLVEGASSPGRARGDAGLAVESTGGADAPVRELAIFGEREMALTGRGEPRRVRVGLASASLFPLLGVEPSEGRLLGPEEEGAGAPRVALLSHGTWRDRFGGDPEVSGTRIRLDGRAFTVVGVLPPGLHVPGTAPWATPAPPREVWIPVGADGSELHPDSHDYEAIARLAQGRTGEEAVAAVAPILRGDRDPEVRGARLEPRVRGERGEVRRGLLLLLGAVGLLLLIACANVATLLVARVRRGEREIATQAALGATGPRIARLLLAESALVGLLGAAAGVPVAWAGRALLVGLAPPELAVAHLGSADLRFLLVGGALGLVTGISFGLLPAWTARRPDLRAALASGGRGVTGGAGGGGRQGRGRIRGRPGLQRGLVAFQVALSLVLLIATGLLARSLAARLRVDHGFRAEQLTTLGLSLPGERYPTREAVSTGLDRIVRELGTLPGVGAVTGASALPFSGDGGSSSFEVEGREVGPDAKKPEALRRAVLPDFHRTLGIPVLAGRTFTAADREGAEGVAAVSRSMAERFWPGGSPLGERILWNDLPWRVVGIVGDVRWEGLEEEVKPAFYLPLHQAPDRRAPTLVLRPTPGAEIGAAAIRRAVWRVDPALPAEGIGTVRALVSRATRVSRFRTLLVTVFAATALVLAAVGVFGVTAHAVGARRRELGIRLAVGADRGRLVREAVAREAPGIGAGLLLGLAGATSAAGLLGRFLFGVDRHDPATYAAAALLLGAVALTASGIAARRAARIDPMEVIRVE